MRLRWPPKRPMTVRLDPATRGLIEDEAEKLGITDSEWVRRAIYRVLRRKHPLIGHSYDELWELTRRIEGRAAGE